MLCETHPSDVSFHYNFTETTLVKDTTVSQIAQCNGQVSILMLSDLLVILETLDIVNDFLIRDRVRAPSFFSHLHSRSFLFLPYWFFLFS